MIKLTNVVRTYPTRRSTRNVLDGVNMTVERGQSLGIMGRNGAGKSTLTRIITGIERPNRGTIEQTMSISWPLGYFGGFHGALTGADNTKFISRIYGLDADEMMEKVQSFAELGEYYFMPVMTYSAGMSARLAFGVSLAVNFDCYVVDEITGAGDHSFVVKSQAALQSRRENGALILISHDPAALRMFCDRGAILENGQLTPYETVEEMIEAYYAL
ncbi:ABC transporter ATP-binding protein [Phenylobacterium immobile]|uniref:ABC transporter ATP-binding protein n=1 Tax=Phenylobacterium immobile TaxID=21 RepID=UPI000A508A6D|nr:ABC transporter ATP-binding protein [Phenylobacterium immobile]